MTILASDIQLMESERMRDTADGGGRQTGEAIVSGEAGNIFPKISRTDAVYGRVNLRKIYLAVRTANNDVYAGAHCIVSAPPANAKVGCVLFSTESAFDNRTAARDRIESYVVAGPLSRLRLYGNQLIGQQAILTYQAESEPLPDTGSVLVLSAENSAGVWSAQQYVRITDVTHEVRVFEDEKGNFNRRVITLKIGSRLNQTFAAGEVTRYSADSNATKVRETQVADASQYYGIQALAEAADIGALSLRLASVYAPLVPSTNRETGVSLAGIGGVAFHLQNGTTPISIVQGPYPGDIPSGGTIDIDLGFLAASISATAQGDAGTYTANAEGIFPTSTIAGAIVPYRYNYSTGVLTYRNHYAQASWLYSNRTITYTPVVDVSAPAHTHQVPVTLATRGSVYAETLLPIPAPGTLVVDFRALGRWYRLRDNGSGVLVANNTSEGTGSVDYVTGATIVTLGALPDVDSAVLYAWGSPAHTTIRAGATTDAATTLQLDYLLAHAPIVPGTFVASYPVNAVSRNATDTGNTGAITGTGVTGSINYATGAVSLQFSTPPDASANLSSAYTWRDGADLLGTATTATITANAFTVPGAAPFRNAGTFAVQFATPYSGVPSTAQAYITSTGTVRVAAGASGQFKFADQQIGTFNATTGVVTFSPASVYVTYSSWAGAGWAGYNGAQAILSVANIAVERNTTAFDPGAVSGEITAVATTGLKLDLTTTVADAVIPGSVMFTATGKTYIDRNGTLYTDVSPVTGSGTVAGTINYTTGVCALSYWGNNVAVARSIAACLTQYGDWTATETFFRTAGSPLRPASLYVQVTGADGTLITGTSDSSGVITGAHLRGTVQQDMGVVAVEFGELVSSVWTPRAVMPGTLRYSCVVITNLPLDPDILGLDPVRLPADGRVPIYRPGDIVAVHHTDTTALTNPVVADGVYSVGRADLYSCTLADATGTAVNPALYSVDLAAGTVTIDAGWTGSGITQPLTATHRVEDMALLSDVQINGQIELSAATTHAYPAGESYVSSALLHGDLQAIVATVFDQSAWTGVWSDALIGSQATAQFDDINYPISCLNESAVTERWRINFTTTTAFQVIGENLGVIATGSTGSVTSPVNPVTGDPYFSLPAGGWGSGWAAGNQLRFNTFGASGPTWIARTILAGASLAGDQFGFEGRGDVD